MMSRPTFLMQSLACVLFVLLCGAQPAAATRTMNELDTVVSGLLHSRADDAFLVVAVPDSTDFVQLAGYGGIAEMDFPQISERQKQLRPKIEEVCESLGLTLRVTVAPNGSEFLDYTLPEDPSQIVEIVKRVLIEVFEVSEATELDIEVNGYEMPNE